MMKESEHGESGSFWEMLSWQETQYKGVFIADILTVSDVDNSKIPFLTYMAVRIDPRALLPPHWHKRGKNWIEKIEIKGGKYELLGFSQESAMGEMVIYNDYLETFGIKNVSDEPIYLTSLMTPGYTGAAENKTINEWW